MMRTRSAPAAVPGRDALANCRFVAQLPRQAQRPLVEAAHLRRYARQECVRRQGDPLTGVAYVLRGIVRLWLVDVDGDDHTVEVGWSGAISLVSLGGPVAGMPWNATTIVPTTMATIPWDAIVAAREICPIDQALMTYAAREYTRRHVWEGLLRSVHLRPRLRMLLRRIGDEMGKATDRGVVLDFPLTQSDLAALASVTRDEVGRAMREFSDAGLVEPIGRRGLLVPDLDRLHPQTDLAQFQLELA